MKIKLELDAAVIMQIITVLQKSDPMGVWSVGIIRLLGEPLKAQAKEQEKVAK
jgi:hypothetical protein